ncbi:MAG: PHP domain-containing protein [Clostridia bacterium]|nr:PHP domain-containing protein [Clostridia bacterium]
MNLQALKNELLSEYPYRIELHAHTSPASSCSEITPQELVATYKGLVYDAVVITNHFLYQSDGRDKEDYINEFLKDFEEAQAIGEEQGVTIYLGAEIRFTENNNDYLIFGVNKELLWEIYDLLPNGIENFRKRYAMPESVFVQAHPKRNGMQPVDPALLDGIEVFNMHPNHNSRVGIAAMYAKEHHISIVTAGSDFHHRNQNHEGVSSLRSAVLPKDSFELAKLLKSGDYLLEIGRNNIIIP